MANRIDHANNRINQLVHELYGLTEEEIEMMKENRTHNFIEPVPGSGCRI